MKTRSSEAPNSFVLRTALLHTESYQWTKPEQTEINYPQLHEIYDVYGCGGGILKEHVEKSARLLFGNDVELVHENFGNTMAEYHELAGVYVFNGTGVISHPVAIILEYRKIGDFYEVVAVLPVTGPANHKIDGEDFVYGFYYSEENRYLVPLEEWKDYLKMLPRHHIVIKEYEDGFQYYAHILPDDKKMSIESEDVYES